MAYVPATMAQGLHGSYSDRSFPAVLEQDIGRRTRSGRTLNTDLSSHSPSRITKSSSRTTSRTRTRNPSPSRNRSQTRSRSRVPKSKASASNLKTPHINQPLSILTANMSIPLRDIAAWVNRPAAERQAETETRNGYVTRPMNSFMLYRSAFAERTKQWCSENNHQVVSQVAGQSWPLEPKEVKEQYEEYARIERDNHAAAHPAYKFSPSKNGPVARARARRIAKGEISDVETDGSDSGADGSGDSEDEYRPRHSRGRGRTGRGRTASPTRGHSRAAPVAPMTPPSQTGPFSAPRYDVDETPPVPDVAPFTLPHSWMVTTHDNSNALPYTSSPDVRSAHQPQDYSSYNFSNMASAFPQSQQVYHQPPMAYNQLQYHSGIQMQNPLQPARMQQPSYLATPPDEQIFSAQQAMPQNYFDYNSQSNGATNQQNVFGMHLMPPAQNHNQLQGLGVYMSSQHAGSSQQVQSIYPELETPHREYHGTGAEMPGNVDGNLDPALFNFELGQEQKVDGGPSNEQKHEDLRSSDLLAQQQDEEFYADLFGKDDVWTPG